MNIKIYGTSGCKKCSKLKQKIEEVAKDENKDEEIKIQKIDDVTKMAEEGIMTTPAVSINEELKIKGSSPSKKRT